MKKFTFGRKKADDDDANRQALFGKKASPAPVSENPYAQSQPANDPYMNDTNKYAPMTSYQQVRARLPEPSANGLPGRPSPQNGFAPPIHSNTGDSGYSSASTANQHSANGFANDKYGAASGYGASKYSNSNGYGGAQARPGGYGGLSSTDSNDTDANRDALFSGVRERYDQKQTTQPNGTYGQSGADSGVSKYGGYGEQRELTEEELEEAEIDDIKRQIKEEKLATAQTAENGARVASQAVNVAMQTMARLGAQSESLNYTESLIDRGSMASRDAEQSTKKLKSLNRSMFAVHVSNPFTASKRTAEMEQQVLEQHRADRELREATRKDGYQGNQRMEETFRRIEAKAKTNGLQQSAAEKSKYAFEDDDDEENAESEQRIQNAEDSMFRDVSKLNMFAHAMSDEVTIQNKTIDRIGSKSDQLSDRTVVHTRRLQSIR
ncbi:uncharacterized protein F4812DRAFT_423909 [Daldinia caldariorum]|uniref:uncharacterized protein n=1 Tax=Daldinia caldariorum TaxID=326644 RepID=UPI002007D46F|nr:uncharacterized protein F4812DRAFT_423909 [Daldinia caldariorum]KAI1468630.1 hypothetical protein F4812DRAFT_423909 [Daldinia caldariorum]